jgi:hypothetical protein
LFFFQDFFWRDFFFFLLLLLYIYVWGGGWEKGEKKKKLLLYSLYVLWANLAKSFETALRAAARAGAGASRTSSLFLFYYLDSFFSSSFLIDSTWPFFSFLFPESFESSHPYSFPFLFFWLYLYVTDKCWWFQPRIIHSDAMGKNNSNGGGGGRLCPEVSILCRQAFDIIAEMYSRKTTPFRWQIILRASFGWYPLQVFRIWRWWQFKTVKISVVCFFLVHKVRPRLQDKRSETDGWNSMKFSCR